MSQRRAFECRAAQRDACHERRTDRIRRIQQTLRVTQLNMLVYALAANELLLSGYWLVAVSPVPWRSAGAQDPLLA
jgi:hypothetical protein